MADGVTLATGPVSWGVDFADSPGNPPWEQVLDDIERSGIGALELGPTGYLPENRETLREVLSSRRLIAVGSFLFDDLHDPQRREAILADAERTCRVIAAADGGVLVVIDRPGDERAATAGRPAAARRLDDGEWRAMLESIRRVADIAARHDLLAVFHPHAGSYVEFEDEVERLLSDCELPLCLDTGHAAYASIQPEHALDRYAERIAHIHLKDVDERVLARVTGTELGFWDAIEAGVFCPLGTGVVDLPAVGQALRRIGFRGAATIEQDRVPGSGAPLDDLRAGLAAVRGAGLGPAPRPRIGR
ncbi:MAG: TIM barrel protein [Solirubrobacteraceae bacterium]